METAMVLALETLVDAARRVYSLGSVLSGSERQQVIGIIRMADLKLREDRRAKGLLAVGASR